MSGHVYVDETKQRGYLLVAAVVVPADLDPLRRLVRSLVLPGQRRLHTKDESDPRRRAIASAIAASGVQATIYDAGGGTGPGATAEQHASKLSYTTSAAARTISSSSKRTKPCAAGTTNASSN